MYLWSPKICCEGSFGSINWDRRSTWWPVLWSIPSPFCFDLQYLLIYNFLRLYRGTARRHANYSFLSLTWFSPSWHSTLEHKARQRTFEDKTNVLGDPHAFCFPFFQLSCSFLLLSVHSLFLNSKSLNIKDLYHL